MRRRDFLYGLVGFSAQPLCAIAQPEKRLRRIGYFGRASAQADAGGLAGFHAGMLALRWVEGLDYVIDARYANGVAQAGPALADELVASRPDLLLAPGDWSVRLLAQSTKSIPIVFAVVQDPVGDGLVASLRRPGGNATGLTSLSSELAGKRLQLLKEAFPRVTRVALLFEPDDVGSVSQAKEIDQAAPRLGMRVTSIALRQPADIEPAFNRVAASRAQACMVAVGGTANNHRQAIVDHVVRLKVPAMFGTDRFVEAGGLMAYGASVTDNFRRAAAYVDKIFKGAKAGELPVQQPTRFELVVNMKTAKAMGFTFPEAFLLRVDRAIE